MKGFRVVTCSWRKPHVALAQTDDMARFRRNATSEMKPRYYGMMETTWTDPMRFIDGFYSMPSKDSTEEVNHEDDKSTPWDTFRAMFDRINEVNRE
jgi:hypothetical protein